MHRVVEVVDFGGVFRHLVLKLIAPMFPKPSLNARTRFKSFCRDFEVELSIDPVGKEDGRITVKALAVDARDVAHDENIGGEIASTTPDIFPAP
jgi:hypothetical protein